MSKHTPGPWRTGSLISYDAFTGEPVAFVYRLPSDNPEETADNRICVRGSRSMDCDADARLIAAAPDLLAALREYHKANRLHHDEEARLYDLSEAAIAKAEGR